MWAEIAVRLKSAAGSDAAREALGERLTGLVDAMKVGGGRPDRGPRPSARGIATRLLPGRPKRIAAAHELIRELVEAATAIRDMYLALDPDRPAVAAGEQTVALSPA